MEREERALVRAEKSKRTERILWHKARLSLLREMGRPKKPRASEASLRVRELEERMEMILERLEMLENSAKK